MLDKQPQGPDHVWWPPEIAELDLGKLKKVLRTAGSVVGVGPRGFHSPNAKALLTGRVLGADAEGAYTAFESLGQSHLTANIPT